MHEVDEVRVDDHEEIDDEIEHVETLVDKMLQHVEVDEVDDIVDDEIDMHE